jgi:hypothetical protein
MKSVLKVVWNYNPAGQRGSGRFLKEEYVGDTGVT